jgi:hypothetical protein
MDSFGRGSRANVGASGPTGRLGGPGVGGGRGVANPPVVVPTVTLDVHQIIPPSVQGAAITGDAFDFVTTSGESYAISQVGTFEEGNTWTGHLEESTTGGGGWTAITGGAFTAVTEGEQFQIIRFTRTKRWVRYVATVVGGSPDLVLAVTGGNVTFP